jgi:hypothetical protein
MTTIALTSSLRLARDRLFQAGRHAAGPAALHVALPPRSTSVPGWNVSFAPERSSVTMDTLRSWTDDDATLVLLRRGDVREERHRASGPWSRTGSRFSSTLVRDDRFRRNGLTNGMRAWLDPPVREAATVFVNERRAGSLWGTALHADCDRPPPAGANAFRIEVANAAINHMAGRALPDYRLLNLRYGTRFEPQGHGQGEACACRTDGPDSLGQLRDKRTHMRSGDHELHFWSPVDSLPFISASVSSLRRTS